MALAGDKIELDETDAVNAKTLAAIRGAKPFSWGQPRNTPRVSAEQQREQRESIEARQADAIARAEAAQAEAAESAVDVDALFTEAITGLVEAKAAEIPLLPPNRQTGTKADWVRHEERVRADERAKIEAAAKPAEDAPTETSNYFDNLGEVDAAAAEPETDETDEVVDDVPYESEGLSWDELWAPVDDEAAPVE